MIKRTTLYVGEIGVFGEWQVIATPVTLNTAWRRKAPSGSATKLDGDTILVGSGSNPDTLIFLFTPIFSDAKFPLYTKLFK